MTTPIATPHVSSHAFGDIPTPPDGFTPSSGAPYRGYLPLDTERLTIDGAIDELFRCKDLGEIFGRAIPASPHVVAQFQRAAHWSAMHAQARFFQEYCRTEERLAWVGLRSLMGRMRPMFDLVVASNPGMTKRFPNLAAFLWAHKDVAMRSAATRRKMAAAVTQSATKAADKPARSATSR